MNNPSDSCFICKNCGEQYELDQPIWRCKCGGLLDIRFHPQFILDHIQSRRPNLWRYREAIALDDSAEPVTFGEGFTPLLPVEIDKRGVMVKQDHLFPSGSYKDRGAAILISQVKALGIQRVVEDSSGNAGCAIAAYCARAHIQSEIYVPADTSPGKLAQIQRYGAELHLIPGSREDTSRAVMAAAEKSYYASHSWNPFFFQGTKTFAYEVCEQLGWRSPDCLVLPAGNGTLLLGAALGFKELFEAQVIDKIPRIYAVQAAACAPLADAADQGLSRIPEIEKKETIAEGIAIAEPVRGVEILQAVQSSGGSFIRVEETEIKKALIEMCLQGFYIEPTAAAAIAGVKKALATIPEDDLIVSVFTGHGLKATDKMLKL